MDAEITRVWTIDVACDLHVVITSPSVARVRDNRRAGALEAATSSERGSISEPPSTRLDGEQAGSATTTSSEDNDTPEKWPYDWRKQ